ncbi:hypothetical protein C5N97_03775 [Akkermansia muciniphila]|nr:hypothetical protein CXU04_05690 [Akkermansia muciniphila]QHV08966.1 hypothetical protein C5N96_03790 [Akkermansia muciniphila]QHV11254.1 hypothetical protein C5N97_03775 [Akkermansia muciniphila]
MVFLPGRSRVKACHDQHAVFSTNGYESAANVHRFQFKRGWKRRGGIQNIIGKAANTTFTGIYPFQKNIIIELLQNPLHMYAAPPAFEAIRQ